MQELQNFPFLYNLAVSSTAGQEECHPEELGGEAGQRAVHAPAKVCTYVS